MTQQGGREPLPTARFHVSGFAQFFGRFRGLSEGGTSGRLVQEEISSTPVIRSFRESSERSPLPQSS